MSSEFRLNMEDLLRQRDGRISVWNSLVHPQQPGVHGPHEARCDLTDTKGRILALFASQSKSRPLPAEHLGLKRRSRNLDKSINHLRNMGFIELTIPDQHQSRNQKMRITEKWQAWLAAQPKS